MNLRHETFIREMIAHGNRQKAYLAAYPSSSHTAAYNNACRLLAIPYIHNRIHDAVRTAEQQALIQFQQEKHITLADTFEKRALLADIILSALPPYVSNKPENVSATPFWKQKDFSGKQPNISQILRAIALDTLLEHGWKQRL
jgi:hypothetical protein